jgi:rhodanese-related sulfurtransferase
MVHQAFTTAQAVFCGLKQWIRLRYPAVSSIEAEQLEQILAGNEAADWLILDARSPAEFAFSHLGGAALVEADGLMADVGSIKKLPRDRSIVVCCSVGVRSAARVDELRRAGFSRAFNLEGGLFQWVHDGRTLLHDGEPTLLVHPCNRLWGRLLTAKNRGRED